ncbi:transcriptional regulator [Streptomyces sp. NPDC048442]|uniref:ParB/RepB/Spo0J family partition protein n=1 Tax=Streptomyces sp. NPDC048442 TaxID=3154823 RepID=UPI00341B33AD
MQENSDAPSCTAATSTAALAGTLDQEIQSVPISSLVPGYSPRLRGEDTEHVARLAELDEELPPILVERATMRVIDGMHRIMAASANGHESIGVRFFDGAAEEAFLLAVRSNTAHGLPLSREDRRAAAQRILAQWPHLSDRAVARSAGVGAKTVAALRAASAGPGPWPQARRGTDGRLRPLDGAEGRRKAVELLRERPHASLREVARCVGISPATVGDVRKRLASGLPPVPERGTPKKPSAHTGATGMTGMTGMTGATSTTKPQDAVSVVSPLRPIRPPDVSPMDKLLRDPSLRHKESGRQLLRLLQRSAVERRELLLMADMVPSHCTNLVADLAKKYAGMWAEFAREVGESEQP